MDKSKHYNDSYLKQLRRQLRGYKQLQSMKDIDRHMYKIDVELRQMMIEKKNNRAMNLNIKECDYKSIFK